MAKTKALISFAVTAKLICVFVFAYADCWFSHGAAQMLNRTSLRKILKAWCRYHTCSVVNYLDCKTYLNNSPYILKRSPHPHGPVVFLTVSGQRLILLYVVQMPTNLKQRCIYDELHMSAILPHYENTPMQYTEIFNVVKNENFQ